MKAKHLKKIRKNLQKNPTAWEIVFRRKLNEWGIKYRFQAVISGFIPDFVLPEYDLVVEIDGSQHYTERGLIRGKYKDAVLNRAGFTVLHIRNAEVKDYKREDLTNFAENLILTPTDREFHNNYLLTLSEGAITSKTY